jgi:hypothetical protein
MEAASGEIRSSEIGVRSVPWYGGGDWGGSFFNCVSVFVYNYCFNLDYVCHFKDIFTKDLNLILRKF